VLDPTSKPVAIFLLVIILCALLSTLLASYFACFGEPSIEGLSIFDNVMEVLFWTDIIRNFFT